MDAQRSKDWRPTIGDVAKLAGVSRSAVSRTFTPGAYASPATEAKVRQAASALGYRPNLVARSLSTRRTGLVAVAITRLDNSFHADLLQHLTRGLSAAGYRTLLFLTDPAEDGDPPIDEVLRHQVEAIVLCAVRLSSHFARECQAAGVPVVLLNRSADAPGVPAVTGDNIGGGRTVAAFLLAGGHRRPALIAGFDDSSTSRDRETGFTGYLAEQGRAPPSRRIGGFSTTQAAEATRDLLRQRSKPDALFCANDHMALAAIDVARREFGLAIGTQLSIVGFDDSRPAAQSGTELTSYRQSASAMAEAGLRLLLSEAPDASPLVVPGKLVIRSSARVPSRGLLVHGEERIWVMAI